MYSLTKPAENSNIVRHSTEARWHPGIKIGLENDWLTRLERTKAGYVEVWYRVDWESKYSELLRKLQEKELQFGLHFWGILPGNIMPNLAYSGGQVAENSLKLMFRTVDVAAAAHAWYVNIHLGTTRLETIDFDQKEMTAIPNSLIEKKLGETTFREYANRLHEYAEVRGVQLYIETIPAKNGRHWQDISGRLDPYDTETLGSQYLETLARKDGHWIANDFCHTASEVPNSTRDQLWTYLHARTQAMAPYTKLIHSNTLRPPFNGTDSHDGILDEDFSHGVFPAKEQFAELLQLFQHRTDVWVINEPSTQHEQNFFALQQLWAQN